MLLGGRVFLQVSECPVPCLLKPTVYDRNTVVEIGLELGWGGVGVQMKRVTMSTKPDLASISRR